MIRLGFILPTGEEVDLENEFNISGSIHLDYVKKYIEDAKSNNPEIYGKWETFCDYYVGSNFYMDFVIRVLKWAKVGNYSMPCKVITCTRNFDVDKGDNYDKVMYRYLKANYKIDCIRGLPYPTDIMVKALMADF